MKWPGCLCIFCLLMTGAQAQVSEQPHNLFLLVLMCSRLTILIREAADIMVRTINSLAESNPCFQYGCYTGCRTVTEYFSLKGFSKTTLPPAELDPKLQIAQAPVYTKITPNALEQEELNSQLRELKVNMLLLSGLMAEQCVYHTAIGALKEGYSVYLIADAVNGQHPEEKRKGAQKLARKGCDHILI